MSPWRFEILAIKTSELAKMKLKPVRKGKEKW